MRADPMALGDAHRESPEELAERHERVRAASLSALAQLLECLLPDQAATAAGAAPGDPGKPLAHAPNLCAPHALAAVGLRRECVWLLLWLASFCLDLCLSAVWWYLDRVLVQDVDAALSSTRALVCIPPQACFWAKSTAQQHWTQEGGMACSSKMSDV